MQISGPPLAQGGKAAVPVWAPSPFGSSVSRRGRLAAISIFSTRAVTMEGYDTLRDVRSALHRHVAFLRLCIRVERSWNDDDNLSPKAQVVEVSSGLKTAVPLKQPPRTRPINLGQRRLIWQGLAASPIRSPMLFHRKNQRHCHSHSRVASLHPTACRLLHGSALGERFFFLEDAAPSDSYLENMA